MTTAWVEAKVDVDGEAAEAVAEALRPFAFQESVVLEQLGDASNLDPEALEPTVAVKVYFPAGDQALATQRRIQEALYFMNMMYPVAEPSFRVLEETDWANAWKAHYEPFRVGERLWIQPSWQRTAPTASDDVILTLDPGMAFGTGLHPTTQMCLQAVERNVTPGATVLDIGTGSGILAIAAAKLGAAQVLGIDNDDQAILAATGNAAINDVADRVTIQAGTLAGVVLRPWSVVLVNILAPVILTLLERHDLMAHVSPGGSLVLSGIVEEQAAGVVAAVESRGGTVRETLRVRDWVTLIVGRNQAPTS